MFNILELCFESDVHIVNRLSDHSITAAVPQLWLSAVAATRQSPVRACWATAETGTGEGPKNHQKSHLNIKRSVRFTHMYPQALRHIEGAFGHQALEQKLNFLGSFVGKYLNHLKVFF